MKMKINEVNDMMEMLEQVERNMYKLKQYMQEISSNDKDKEFREKMGKIIGTDSPLWTFNVCCESLDREWKRYYEVSQKEIEVGMDVTMKVGIE